jgi:hypothetical protein
VKYANPPVGFNALGGALSMRTRPGAQSTSASLRGGSFGRVDRSRIILK